MSASSPVPENHPLMVAWTAYKATEDYANTKRWAGHDDGATDGSLWASFERGWLAAGGRAAFSAAPPPAVAPAALVAIVRRQVELLGQCEAFIADRFDADDGDAVALSNSIHAIRKTLERTPDAAAPPVAPPTGEAGALREALRDLAGTIVAICDSGTNLAHLACMDNSPLVGECRSILAVMAGAEPHTAKEAALAAALAAPVPAAPPDLVAQRDRLQMTLMRLVGVSTRTELEEMEALLRSLPGIDDDRSAALDAIHALLAYPLPPKEPTR